MKRDGHYDVIVYGQMGINAPPRVFIITKILYYMIKVRDMENSEHYNISFRLRTVSDHSADRYLRKGIDNELSFDEMGLRWSRRQKNRDNPILIKLNSHRTPL